MLELALLRLLATESDFVNGRALSSAALGVTTEAGLPCTRCRFGGVPRAGEMQSLRIRGVGRKLAIIIITRELITGRGRLAIAFGSVPVSQSTEALNNLSVGRLSVSPPCPSQAPARPSHSPLAGCGRTVVAERWYQPEVFVGSGLETATS